MLKHIRMTAVLALAGIMALQPAVLSYADEEYYIIEYDDCSDEWTDEDWAAFDAYVDSLDDYYSEFAYITDAYWSGRTAKYSYEGSASKFQIRLYRNGKLIHKFSTTNKSKNMNSYITKSGDYSFQVRAYTKNRGWSDWVSSDEDYFTADSGSSSSSGSGSSGGTVIYGSGPGVAAGGAGQWIQAADGSGKWWYRHSDGNCTKSAWEQINGKWYYFDASGWMTIGWVNVNGKSYYCDGSGAMVTGNYQVNGVNHYFDSHGEMLY